MGLLRSAVMLGPKAAMLGPKALVSVAALPVRAVRAVPAAIPVVTSGVGGMTDLIGGRKRRRVWSQDGRAYIEVRRISVKETRTLHKAVARTLNGLEGVHWAEINAVTGEVLVAFDEGTVSASLLVDTVEAVEDAHGGCQEQFPDHGHPADPAPLAAETIALAADWVAFGLATAGRVARWPRVPRAARVGLAVIDSQPRLRRKMEARLGRRGTDLVLAIGNAVMHGLTQEPEALAVDGIYRLLLVSELQERHATWRRRERELYAAGLPSEIPQRRPRPGLLPAGPVETYGDRAALGTLLGAGGLLALTRDPGAAAELVLASVPRAAMLGRDAFAAVLSRSMGRQGVIPMRGSAYRRLDRVTAIVVDSDVLCEDGLEILSASGTRIWRLAARLLEADPELTGCADKEGRRLVTDGPGGPYDPSGARVRIEDRNGKTIGEFHVGRRLDPFAESVLAAARESGAKLLLTEHAATAELLPLADETLAGETPLADHIRKLQENGEGVLLVTHNDHDAAGAADVSIGVLAADRTTGWSADLICGPGLEQVWQLLTVVGVAREASRRSVRMALGGSALGALLVVTGRRRAATAPIPLDLAPVHTAALVAMVGSALAVRRAMRRRLPTPQPRIAWHALAPETALARAQRLGSELRPAGPRPRTKLPRPLRPVSRLANAVAHELGDPLTPVLVLGAAASAIVGSGIDAALVGGVMSGNALISGVQRMRAESSLDRLLISQRTPARRRRPGTGGSWDMVPAQRLRIGDVILLGASDVVPADARLLTADDLEVDESSLTGESLPVSKSTDPVPGADLAERSCMLFEDTTVLAGHATAVVVATGDATQAGRAAAIAGTGHAPGGVQAQLNELTKIALPVTGLSGALVSALAFVRGVSVREAISSGVSVAIAAVPEGLPLVATVAQTAAARRLSRRNVLVRTSRTLGTMGRVDTLCFDKTGTLTEGRLRLTRLSGLARDTAADSDLGRRLLTAAARACPPGDQAALRHATDRAVTARARQELGDDEEWRLVHETPFEASRGFAAAAGLQGGNPYVAVKGAPEVVLPRCSSVRSGAATHSVTEEQLATARATVRRLAEAGLRVLAVAEAHPDPAAMDTAEKLGETADLVLLGFIGIADALRAEAPPAIDRLTRAGIRVVMITGDHPATAQAIAADLGIPDPDRVLTGADLDRLSDRDRTEQIAATSVFARVGPEHKVRIVQSLQRAGRIVAMTGDGSNDAAAIRLADVGIGISSGDSRAAQSAADLILPGADLPGIVDALMEGRALWESVRNAVSILVGGNAGEVTFTVYGTAVGGRAPLSTRQLLLVNTLTDMMPALAVALAPPAQGVGEKPAESNGGGLLDDPLNRAIVLRGTVTALGAILAWQSGRFTGRHRRASTMGLAALVTTQLIQTLQTGWRSPAVVATCAASMIVLTGVIEIPGVSQFFDSTPLGPLAWALVLGSALASTGAGAVLPRVVPRLGR